jgi:hypothetical protein
MEEKLRAAERGREIAQSELIHFKAQLALLSSNTHKNKPPNVHHEGHSEDLDGLDVDHEEIDDNQSNDNDSSSSRQVCTNNSVLGSVYSDHISDHTGGEIDIEIEIEEPDHEEQIGVLNNVMSAGVHDIGDRCQDDVESNLKATFAHQLGQQRQRQRQQHTTHLDNKELTEQALSER